MVPVLRWPTVPTTSSFEETLPSLKLMLYSLPLRLIQALELLRERVDDRHADAVQAAGEFVVLVVEFAAGVQAREDQLDAAHLLLADGCPPACRGRRRPPTSELSLCSVTLISLAWPASASSTRVVDDFVREVIRPRGVGVHARAAAHGLETGQDFDVRSAIVVAHCPDPRSNGRIVRAPREIRRGIVARFRFALRRKCFAVHAFARILKARTSKQHERAPKPTDGYHDPGLSRARRREARRRHGASRRSARRTEGHKTSILTIRHDVDEIIEGLKQAQAELVFNLVESFGDDILGRRHGRRGRARPARAAVHRRRAGRNLSPRGQGAHEEAARVRAGFPIPDFATFFRRTQTSRPAVICACRYSSSRSVWTRRSASTSDSLVRNTQQLMERVLYIHKTFGDAALAEEYIEGREFYVGVLGNDEPRRFPPLEMDFSGLEGRQPSRSWTPGQVRRERATGTTARRWCVPTLEPELERELQKVSIEAYRALRVHDYGRIDLRLTDTGEIYVIEVNANCYLEQHSEFARRGERARHRLRDAAGPDRGARARALETPKPRAEAPEEGARRARPDESPRCSAAAARGVTAPLSSGSAAAALRPAGPPRTGKEPPAPPAHGARRRRAQPAQPLGRGRTLRDAGCAAAAAVSGKYAPRCTKFIASEVTRVVTPTIACASAARG